MSRPKQFDPDAAVDRAMDLFWRKGFAATTPQDLVDELGIGKGSLYGTFGSKRALFGRALDHYRQQQGDTLTAILEGPGPVKDRIRAALMAIIETNATDAARRGCLAVNTAAELGGVDAGATAAVGAMFARNQQRLEEVLLLGQATGQIRTDIPARGLAIALLAQGTGLQLLVKAAVDPYDLVPAVDAAIAAL